MEHTFETATPPQIAVEIGSGHVELTAGETNGRTLVTVTGKGAEETTAARPHQRTAWQQPEHPTGISRPGRHRGVGKLHAALR